MGLLDSKKTQLTPYLYQLMKTVEEMVEEVQDEITVDVLLVETDADDETISEKYNAFHDYAW